MNDVTRIARVHPTLEPLRNDGWTRVPERLRTLRRGDLSDLFLSRQRMMASALAEEPRPGLFVFAAHLDYGHVGRLWLEATDTPRAGFVGRHEHVDLALPCDETLSLRHLMFIVRRAKDGGVRFTALDLCSSVGLQLESGDRVHRVDAAGPLIVSASDFVFFCIPTGQPLPWSPAAERPWSTLLPRVHDKPRKRRHAEELAGTLELCTPFGAQALEVTRGELEGALLVGRSERCHVVTRTDSVSRVHVAILRVDDTTWLYDTGSTNGTWRVTGQVKRAELSASERFVLGHDVTLHWREA
jgi:hypothetical protein